MLTEMLLAAAQPGQLGAAVLGVLAFAATWEPRRPKRVDPAPIKQPRGK